MEKISLLVGGRESFDRIITNIDHAQKHIKINMFIWRDDCIGNEVAVALINAANRGVKVHISKDRLGMIFEYAEEEKHSFFHHNLYTRWYIQGIILDYAYPMKGKVKRVAKGINPNFTKIMNHDNIFIDCNRVKMDHSKYYIFDHEIIILGGINIEDKEVSSDVSGMAYHDYMLEIRDSSVVKLFKKRLYGYKKYSSKEDIEFIFNRMAHGKKEFLVKDKLIYLLELAKDSVDIVMAYIGDPDINYCIVNLIDKGVNVNLYLPKKANLQNDLNMKQLKALMIKTKNKVNVYLSDKMIHAKLIRIDDYIVTVGSTNLNNQAMVGLMELNIVLNNKNTSRDLSRVFFELDKSICELRENSLYVNDNKSISYCPLKAFFEGLV